MPLINKNKESLRENSNINLRSPYKCTHTYTNVCPCTWAHTHLYVYIHTMCMNIYHTLTFIKKKEVSVSDQRSGSMGKSASHTLLRTKLIPEIHGRRKELTPKEYSSETSTCACLWCVCTPSPTVLTYTNSDNQSNQQCGKGGKTYYSGRKIPHSDLYF